MKKANEVGIVLVLFGATAVLLAVIFKIPVSEGINPSDEGVILAQAYRILAGELPHRDFISIRPVGSALFHSVSFLISGSPVVASRWVVLLQYIIYSFIWAWILFRGLPEETRKKSLFFLLLAVIFTLNQNHYNLFAWTTIDGLFFFSIGYFFYRRKRVDNHAVRWPLFRYFLIIFFAGYAVLCRQTFALPFLFLCFAILVEAVRERRVFSLLGGGIAGMLPWFVYLGLLIFNGSLDDFIRQMTGRTELWETGVLAFGLSFWRNPVLPLVLFLILTALFIRLTKTHPDDLIRSKKIANPVGFLLVFFVLLIAVLAFVDPVHLFLYSYSFFWLLLGVLILIPVITMKRRDYLYDYGWILIIAWTSAISLGDNAPVFATGMLAGATLTGSLRMTPASTHLINSRLSGYAFYLITAGLLGLSIFGQRQNNYRDGRAADLHFMAGESIHTLGRIRTNERTANYFNEIHRIFNALGAPYGRFAMLPNAAIVYPLLDSRNPLPLDWMQGAEFAGLEDDLWSRLSKLEKGEGIYLLFDTYDSKLMADSLVRMNFNPGQYPYYQGLIDASRPVDSISSEWFEIRLWK